jgi:hypothetical protein
MKNSEKLLLKIFEFCQLSVLVILNFFYPSPWGGRKTRRLKAI